MASKEYMSAPLSPSPPLGYHGENEHVVEFDRKKGFDYMCIVPSIVSPCCFPVIWLCARKEIDSQKCKVTDRRLVFESGWLNHSSRNIPLDRIQDVNVRQDCIAKCFHVKNVEIQTAGSGSVTAEATLIAPHNAEMLRDVIMERRDALVFGQTGLVTETGVTGGKPRLAGIGAARAEESAVLNELSAIHATLARLEAQVTKGVDHLTDTA